MSGEDTYANVLEHLLNKKNSGKKVEVLNLGVGGYSTQQEAIALKNRGIRWDPELIIGYVLNDPQIDPYQPLPAQFSETKWWQNFNITRLAAKFKYLYDLKTLGNGDYYIYLHNDRRKWQSVVSGFKQIRIDAMEKDIPVLLVVFPIMEHEGTKTKEDFWDTYKYKDLHERVSLLGAENGFYVIDLYDYYSQYKPIDLKSAPNNHHPSKLGHQVAAQAILNWIIENNKLLPDIRLKPD